MRLRENRITSLMYGDSRLESKEAIINHIEDFFTVLYTKEEWNIPSLENLAFNSISGEKAAWLERDFEIEEVQNAVFAIGNGKALGPDGFPIAFFEHF